MYSFWLKFKNINIFIVQTFSDKLVTMANMYAMIEIISRDTVTELHVIH